MSDMFFDTADFDFTSLQDIVDIAEPKQERTKEDITINGGIIDDISDLVGDDYEPTLNDEENDYNADARDLEPVEKRNGVDLSSYFNDTDDEAYINFDGVELTKKELKTLAQSKQRIEEDSTFLREQAERFAADNKLINQRSLMQQNVLEQNISILRNRANNPNITDTDYAQTMRNLQQAESALFMLNKETNEILAQREKQQQQINGYRIRVADQALSNDSPEWSKYKGEILNYALELGIPASVIENNYDVGLMKMAMKAYMHDKKVKAVTDKLKAQQTAQNARSTTGAKSSTRTAQETAAISARKVKAINSIGSSRTANVSAFDFLVD